MGTAALKSGEYSTSVEFTFLFKYLGKLAKIDHILGNKLRLNTLLKTGSVKRMLSNHSGIKLEITIKNITKKSIDI